MAERFAREVLMPEDLLGGWWFSRPPVPRSSG
jgi:hypothetical protein